MGATRTNASSREERRIGFTAITLQGNKKCRMAQDNQPTPMAICRSESSVSPDGSRPNHRQKKAPQDPPHHYYGCRLPAAHRCAPDVLLLAVSLPPGAPHAGERLPQQGDGERLSPHLFPGSRICRRQRHVLQARRHEHSAAGDDPSNDGPWKLGYSLLAPPPVAEDPARGPAHPDSTSRLSGAQIGISGDGTEVG